MSATKPPTAPPLKNFTVRYIYRSAGRTFASHTVWAATTRKEALRAIQQEYPHIISASIVP